jgi:hypothetical protein
MVLKWSDEVSSLAASMSLVVDLIEGHINAVAANVVYWEAQLTLTAALSHFLSWSLS